MPGKKPKGMSTAQRKERYLNDLAMRQGAQSQNIEIKKTNTYLNAAQRGGMDITDSNVRQAIDNNVANDMRARQRDVYNKQLNAAGKRFDVATKYDDMLGRSTNPDSVKPKYNMFTMGGQTTSINKNNKKQK